MLNLIAIVIAIAAGLAGHLAAVPFEGHADAHVSMPFDNDIDAPKTDAPAGRAVGSNEHIDAPRIGVVPLSLDRGADGECRTRKVGAGLANDTHKVLLVVDGDLLDRGQRGQALANRRGHTNVSVRPPCHGALGLASR